MKIVNKYILVSCVFCYFAGLYMIAVKAGIMRLLSRYGISQILNEWPKDFPSIGLVSAFVAVYTILFIIITIWIYKANERHAEATDKLQQETAEIRNYAEELSLTISSYKQLVAKNIVTSKSLIQQLQLLQKQITSMHPSIFKDPTSVNCLNRIISEIGDTVNTIKEASPENVEALNVSLAKQIEDDLIEVKRIKSNSITIK